MENKKLQELTSKLYEEGLSKGREEAAQMVAEAEAKREKTLARRGSEKKKPTPRFGDFDPEEAFRLALNRSFEGSESQSDGSDGKE